MASNNDKSHGGGRQGINVEMEVLLGRLFLGRLGSGTLY